MSSILRLILLTLFVLTGQVSQTKAQNDTTKNKVYGAFLILPIEFPIIDKTSLDQQLSSYGLPAANFSTANLGIGAQLYVNRFITTFSFNKNTKKDKQDNYLTEVEYRSTSLNVGYDLTRSHWYSIYPFVGFKGSGLSYLFRERLPDETAMATYLQTDLQYKEITNSRAHLDLGIGLSHQWFYLVNFRFGYLLPIEKVKWNMNNNQTTLTDSPAIDYSYYFTLTIGLGNIGRENEYRDHYNR